MAAEFPILTMYPPSPKLARQPQVSQLTVELRQLPVLSVRLQDRKLAPLLAHFPIQLHPIRTAYLAPATRSTLKLEPKSDLLVEALAPELLGQVPLAVWSLTEAEVEKMARANVSGGALLLKLEVDRRQSLHRVFSPFWLDWQGWSGYVRHLARAPHTTDEATLRHLAWELNQRGGGEVPSGLHTARAALLATLEEAAEAVAACQDEVLLHLDTDQLPKEAALDALALMGQQLERHQEPEAARAAYSLALAINPNHQQALLGILPLLHEEEALLDALARLGRMPVRPSVYPTLLERSANKIGMGRSQLEQKVDNLARARGRELWSSRPEWLSDTPPAAWLSTLGF